MLLPPEDKLRFTQYEGKALLSIKGEFFHGHLKIPFENALGHLKMPFPTFVHRHVRFTHRKGIVMDENALFFAGEDRPMAAMRTVGDRLPDTRPICRSAKAF
ncbi:hypothetical protein [Hydrogenibacillus sp. N12]|uniref:hypothetical protein n=1 Tax=Hydrogenibacillus sp. N12 TaxID=2866627 RepID=UPI00207BD765|nr:hypothetical protein [Hydrogenibacillus sp. N12]